MPTMMKPRLKMAMAAAEMLYSVRHTSAGTPGPQEGLGVPSPIVPAPRLATALHSAVPVSQVRTLRAREEIIPSEWHMSKGWGQDVRKT